tara:strand:+ start:223 stop:642 length:420 start_codon:yes stop_codon:yes gene_type:complete
VEDSGLLIYEPYLTLTHTQHHTIVLQQIYRQDGVSGFWRGLPPTLVGIIPSRATYFWAYETSKKLLAKTWVGDGTMNHIVSGSMAGITGNTLTNPIWMVKTRMQLLPGEGQLAYTGYSHAVKTIYKVSERAREGANERK